MIEIEILRHVKVDGEPALYGKTDIPALKEQNQQVLTALSQQVETKLSSRANYYNAIFSSPLQRCFTLGQLYSQQENIPLIPLEGMQEMDFGLFDGVSFDDIDSVKFTHSPKARNKEQQGTHSSTKNNWQLLEAFWQNPAVNTLPSAESLSDFNARVLKSWHEMINTLLTNKTIQQEEDQPTKRILLICHGGVVRILLAYLLKLDWKSPTWYQNLHISNASISKVIVNKIDAKKICADVAGEQTNLYYQVRQIGAPLLPNSP